MFKMTLWQMLTMFAFILVGYILRKRKILPESSGATMARLETYLFCPALSLANMMSQCTPKTFRENSSLILYGAAVTAVALVLAVPLSRLFIRRADTAELAYQRSIYQYGMTFANYGFMGNFIIIEMFGDVMFFKYQMFCLVLSIFCTSYGLYLLIPKEQNAGLWQNLKKGLLAPPTLAIFVGVAVGLLGLSKYVPTFLFNMLDGAGKCQGPVAMVLAGFVIAGYPLREIFVNKKVYVAALARLVFIPAIFLLVLHMLGTTKELMMLTLIAFGTPLGLNSIVYPETYGGDVKTGASMASISHTLCVATIPFMYWLFIEVL